MYTRRGTLRAHSCLCVTNCRCQPPARGGVARVDPHRLPEAGFVNSRESTEGSPSTTTRSCAFSGRGTALRVLDAAPHTCGLFLQHGLALWCHRRQVGRKLSWRKLLGQRVGRVVAHVRQHHTQTWSSALRVVSLRGQASTPTLRQACDDVHVAVHVVTSASAGSASLPSRGRYIAAARTPRIGAITSSSAVAATDR